MLQSLTVRHVDEDVVDEAWRWLRRHDERCYSVVDATRFALMRRLRLQETLAFDGDFAAAGFVEVRPDTMRRRSGRRVLAQYRASRFHPLSDIEHCGCWQTGGVRAVLVAVVGPTAVGKSAFAVRLALALGGEVAGADSMQLYRGMDIGTAKITLAQRRGVPHHLLDIWDVRQPASVAEYQRLARRAVADIAGRGRTPILVGGSGLYVRAVLDNLDFPGTDPRLRQRLEAELARHGAAALHRRLAAVDPAAAAAILPSNGRRIVRALEVIELTGRPFTATLPGYGSTAGSETVPRPEIGTAPRPGNGICRSAVQIGLRLPRDELDRRIAARVEWMWRVGFEQEVRRLERHGLREGRTASRALGYAQMLRVLAGEWTSDEARTQTVRATRRFARRQESWFRRDPRVIWLDATTPEDVLLARVLEVIDAHRAADAGSSASR